MNHGDVNIVPVTFIGFFLHGMMATTCDGYHRVRNSTRKFFKCDICSVLVVLLHLTKERFAPLRRGWELPTSRQYSSRFRKNAVRSKPKASEVLTAYLKQTCEPPWTSYFVKYVDVVNDQYGMSHFNWQVGQSNYTVLRVGCFPFIKYHCTRGPRRDLDAEDKFFRFIKVANLGIPCLMYGIAALFLIRHKELVCLKSGNIYIYFLIKENLGSHH